jgi:hypothetical protein
MPLPTLKFKSIPNPRVLIRATAPQNHTTETLAALTVEPGGTDAASNQLTLTSNLTENLGNLITFEMTSAPTAYETIASAVELTTGGEAITVALAGLSRMVVTGTLKVTGAGATVTFPALYWDDASELPRWVSANGKYWVTRNEANTAWLLVYSENLTDVVASWTSTSDVATPDLVPVGAGGWTAVVAESGTPAVAKTLPTAAQVKTAIEADLDADRAVTVTYPGAQSGVGVVAVYAEADLVGGTFHTRPQYLGQDCIVNDADVYKCVRLSPVTWVKLNA